MRRTILSAAVLAAVFGSSMAFAGVTTGVVQSVQQGASVTLQDGTVYTLTDDSMSHEVTGGFLPGDAVTIHWTMDGPAHDILAISPDFSGMMTGVIAAVDDGARSVTLDNGTSYSFNHDDGAAYDLTDYKVGDMVAIVPGPDGSGRSIAPVFVSGMSGAVKAIDMGARTVTLADGTVFHFDDDTGAELAGFRVGDMVRIETHMVGGQHWATAISPA
jgi:ribosomal protein L21E